jgi:hypothetical protein
MTTRDTHDINAYELEKYVERIMEAIRIHAQIQIDFDLDLQRDTLPYSNNS